MLNKNLIMDQSFTTLYIGRSQWSNDEYFDGDIYYVKLTLADGTKYVDIDFSK